MKHWVVGCESVASSVDCSWTKGQLGKYVVLLCARKCVNKDSNIITACDVLSLR